MASRSRIQQACRLQSILLPIVTGLFFSNAAIAAQSIDFSKLKRNDSIYAGLPQKFKDAKVINAATESDYPPFDFLDEKNQLAGADVDISHALGIIMGVPIKNTNTDFSAIIPGIQAGRFDIGVSSMGDYVAREKTMDFVDYYQGGTSAVIAMGAKAPEKLDDFCGTAIGVLKGTSSETSAEATSKYCTDKGKPAVTVNAYPTQSAALLALSAGRIQAVTGDSATNGYSAKNTSLKIRNVPLNFQHDSPYYGIPVPKDTPLSDSLMQAMKVLMDSGVYAQILEKWGISDGAIKAPLKNHPSAQ